MGAEHHASGGERHPGLEQRPGEVVLPVASPGGEVEEGDHAEVVDHRHLPIVDRGLDGRLERRRHRGLPALGTGAQVARLDPGVATAVPHREHDQPGVERGRGGTRARGYLPANRTGDGVEGAHRGLAGFVPRRDHRAGRGIDARPRPERTAEVHRPADLAGRDRERGERAREVARQRGVARDRDRVGVVAHWSMPLHRAVTTGQGGDAGLTADEHDLPVERGGAGQDVVDRRRPLLAAVAVEGTDAQRLVDHHDTGGVGAELPRHAHRGAPHHRIGGAGR